MTFVKLQAMNRAAECVSCHEICHQLPMTSSAQTSESTSIGCYRGSREGAQPDSALCRVCGNGIYCDELSWNRWSRCSERAREATEKWRLRIVVVQKQLKEKGTCKNCNHIQYSIYIITYTYLQSTSSGDEAKLDVAGTA